MPGVFTHQLCSWDSGGVVDCLLCGCVSGICRSGESMQHTYSTLYPTADGRMVHLYDQEGHDTPPLGSPYQWGCRIQG